MAGTTVVATSVSPTHSAEYRAIAELNNVVDDLATVATGSTGLADHVDYLLTPDGVIGGSYAFSVGGAATLAASGWVKYRIAGVEYCAEMPATITLEDVGNVTQNNYSAWRIEISRLGAVTAKASPTVGGYATAQIALLALGGLAPTASCCTLGYLTLTDSDSAINIGTDNLNASGVTAAIYYERGPRKRIAGLNTALGAASALVSASTTYGHGTININRNGLKVAEIAAGATQALTDADTIATLKFGAVLICTDLAGTGKVSVNAAGTPGVTAMSYDSAALALAAVNLVVDRLPAMFVPFALIQVSNQTVGTFTFKTTAWNTALVTATITDATVGGWDRTVASGFDSHQVTRSAIAADATAGLTAAKINSTQFGAEIV
jgi:hypothetical protein